MTFAQKRNKTMHEFVREGKPQSEFDQWLYREQCKAVEFYRDLRGTLHLTGKGTSGIVSVQHIAEVMNIETWKAMEFVSSVVFFGISEFQGGGLVV